MNNDHKYDDNDKARTKSTSFFDTTTILWSDAFLAGRGVILTMMMTATMTTKTMTTMTMIKDNDKETNGKDNNALIF